MAGKRPRRRSARNARESRLRIIGGQWRSRMLPVADQPGLRPTPNRVRETLFNWLAPYLPGARCIDLFAGTGILGIEALSRGADRTDFIESDQQAAAAIEMALSNLTATDRGRVLVADGLRVSGQLAGERADIVFIDPPFRSQLHGAALAGVRPLVDAASRVYLEYPAADEAEINTLLAADYEVLRQTHAASIGYCLARLRAASDHGMP